MLRARYRDGELILEEPVDLREGAEVVLEVLVAPRGGTLGTLTITKVHAAYRGGVLVLHRGLKVPPGGQVSIAALSEVRSLQSFRGVLGNVKEDSVTLQHQAREWWGQSAH